MKWQDTLLSDEQMFLLVADRRKKKLLKQFPGTAKMADDYIAIAKAQAKASFKAGIK